MHEAEKRRPIAAEFDIPEIHFNGTIYCHVAVTESAARHFGQNTERYFRYIAGYLDGQVWKPVESGRDGTPEFLTASAITYIKNLDADSDYRETAFRVYPMKRTIEFFHGCSIRKGQYELALHKMRLQMED